MFDYYQLTVPVYTRALKQLAHILDKAAEYAAAKKVSDETMLGLRLAPDMFSLVKQVQIVCDNAKFAVARLSGTQAPKHDDSENSFAELQARIAATLRFVESLPQAAFVDAEKRTITLPFMPDKPMSAEFYLLSFVQPNLYFHLSTAYAILRHNGVDVGKSDYIGEM
ncbi:MULTISPECIES: DUF1993 domain-containing protein [Deefgea]|uniref:DUF1993 family protein n=1 Tax=Deefgea chitinilytica TaxID=570276 RepID=A0ABS2CFN3_9NEIS|nr:MULTISPECIES: DUF1993 domain-containing protein [Deefgea]MBM5572951.1 DUF1993 family protein [Deefgea chitinilytica]MBM9890187.1 DUF1993 domain-containing protein [Deefgea sp. CFH1-16]